MAYIPKEAYSGAAIIALGADEIYMHPHAQIGDAGPIEMRPGQPFERAPEKVLGPLREMMRELAERKGRPAAIAMAMAILFVVLVLLQTLGYLTNPYLGLVVFVAIVGINAGNSLLAQLTGAIAFKIFIVGFVNHIPKGALLLVSDSPMTPEGVKSGAASVASVTDFDARYAKTLELVRADIAQGLQLGVRGTPTFFMNGIRLPNLRGEFFQAAVEWELRRLAAQ